MSHPVLPDPLPTVGPNTNGNKQDGSLPGCTFAAGTWRYVNGVLTLVKPFQAPGGFEVK